VLGEAFVDSLAVPGEPPGSISAEPVAPLLSEPDLGSTTPVAAEIPASEASAAAPAAPAPAPSKPAAHRPGRPFAGNLKPVAFHTASKRWLLMLYLLWQISVLGTMASLWWWRQEARA